MLGTLVGLLCAATGLASDAPLCLPHNCSRVPIDDAFAARVAELRSDLDALGAALPPYAGHANGSRALLVTMGGPPRAESIVQAFVALAVLRGAAPARSNWIESVASTLVCEPRDLQRHFRRPRRAVMVPSSPLTWRCGF